MSRSLRFPPEPFVDDEQGHDQRQDGEAKACEGDERLVVFHRDRKVAPCGRHHQRRARSGTKAITERRPRAACSRSIPAAASTSDASRPRRSAGSGRPAGFRRRSMRNRSQAPGPIVSTPPCATVRTLWISTAMASATPCRPGVEHQFRAWSAGSAEPKNPASAVSTIRNGTAPSAPTARCGSQSPSRHRPGTCRGMHRNAIDVADVFHYRSGPGCAGTRSLRTHCPTGPAMGKDGRFHPGFRRSGSWPLWIGDVR